MSDVVRAIEARFCIDCLSLFPDVRLEHFAEGDRFNLETTLVRNCPTCKMIEGYDNQNKDG